MGVIVNKSSVDEIRRRFDADVERFSNLQTGQSATMDAPLILDLISRCAAAVNPEARNLLDVGCGAGNYTLKLMEKIRLTHVTLVDLSQPMLDRAAQRISAADPHIEVRPIQADIRDVQLEKERFDVVTAAAVLHHLRTDAQWHDVFSRLHAAIVRGGSLWVSDLVDHQNAAIGRVVWQRYADHLEQLNGPEYRDKVIGYVEAEDSPRPLIEQMEILRKVGFRQIDILHANTCFAAYAAIK